ncbi:hypothetical protein LPJ81_004401 [Coemansia sp. IMI 209127]|nr:hypothetical protein LPJ81_004401 [Coemansia sp. IMI 209127]
MQFAQTFVLQRSGSLTYIVSDAFRLVEPEATPQANEETDQDQAMDVDPPFPEPAQEGERLTANDARIL